MVKHLNSEIRDVTRALYHMNNNELYHQPYPFSRKKHREGDGRRGLATTTKLLSNETFGGGSI